MVIAAPISFFEWDFSRTWTSQPALQRAIAVHRPAIPAPITPAVGVFSVDIFHVLDFTRLRPYGEKEGTFWESSLYFRHAWQLLASRGRVDCLIGCLEVIVLRAFETMRSRPWYLPRYLLDTNSGRRIPSTSFERQIDDRLCLWANYQQSLVYRIVTAPIGDLE